MAHQVETMAYANAVPWHGLGTQVDQRQTVEQMLVAAGIDWEVEKRAMFTRLANGSYAEVPGHSALTRVVDDRVLDVVGSRWTPGQNRETMEFFRSFVEQGGATLETMGSLKGGRLVWGLANLGQGFELPGRDRVSGYLLLASPHQANKGYVARVTPVRVVCANTMAMAMSGTAALEHRWSHSAAFDPVEAAEAMGLIRENFSEFEKNARLLRRLRLSEEEVIGILAPIYQPRGVTKSSESPLPEELTSLLIARPELMNPTLTRVMTSYATAPGAQVGTGWGVLNGATHYADHVAREASADSRLASAWLGKEARRKSQVLDSLMALAS